MSFTNPITGNNGALLIPAIKSPDYVAGVSGWSINKDGSAEFNDLTVRFTAGLVAQDCGTANAGGATFSTRRIYYTLFGKLVWFNVRLVVFTAGSGTGILQVDPLAFTFENQAPNGDTLPQIFPMTYTGLSGAAGGAVALPNPTGTGEGITSAGDITQLRCADGSFIRAGHLAINGVISIQGYGLVDMP